MINYIQIENFKSLKRLSLPLQNLNLFFGMNGMGKSSVIQSLLLLRQSFWENHKSNLDYLYTNGDLIRLGTGKDIWCQSAAGDKIRFYVQYDNKVKHDCSYIYDVYDSESDELERVGKRADEDYSSALFAENFSYLGAEHLGPRKQYSVENWKRNGVIKLGTAGEFVVPFLAMEGDRITVSDKMCHKLGKTNRLMDQVSAWMAEISPGIRLTAQLISLAAENGCQIICESHSDHVINGVRVAAKQGVIGNEKIGITYFSKNGNQETKTDNIYVDRKGNLSDYRDNMQDFP